MKLIGCELQILVKGKNDKWNTIPEYGKDGKTYIEGRKGSEFTIRFRNNHPNKILVIPSVDGLSIIDGKPATKESRGVIIDAYSSSEIKGWRTSLLESSKFVFKKKGKSFSNEQGYGVANCGVIGCLVYEEKKREEVVIKEYVYTYPWWYPYWYPYHPKPWTPPYPNYRWYCSDVSKNLGSTWGESNATSDSVKGLSGEKTLSSSCYYADTNTKSIPDFDLGVGHGRRVSDEVREEHFNRGNKLGLLEIYYTSKENLEKIGIDVSKAEKLETQEVPRSFADSGFCNIS